MNSYSSYTIDDYEGLSALFTEVEQLPSAGYCSLYRAKRYGRWYLLKCLTAEHEGDEAFQQMLRKELEVLMSLQHPAVMQAVGMEPVMLPGRGGVMCLVAEWIDGMTLADFLKQRPAAATLRRVAAELADAVAYVHQQQVVHRDLKPQNIMITHNGHYVKLIDFGLADTGAATSTWAPDRQCHVRYLGNQQFRVEASQNTRLHAGDYFQCSLIVEGEPLYLSNLLQPGRLATNYVCGKQGGIRFEKK